METSQKGGHTFLASLGKARLRPGGVEAAEWLFSRAGIVSTTVLVPRTF